MSAVVLTAAIGATVAAMPAGPASAQSADWTPPPDAGVPVSDLRMDGPPEDYQKESECVEAAQLDEVQQLRNAPWGQQYLRLAEVHRTMEAQGMRPGAGQNVSVIDTGVWDGHQYFQGRVHGIGEYVKKESDHGDGVLDCDGHGTEVAGIIGARTPNDVGFTGVAPYSTIKSIRQSSESYQKNDEETQQPNPGGGQGGDGGQGGGQGGNGGDGGQGGGQGGNEGGNGGGTGGSAATDSSQRQAESSEGAGTIESLAAAIVKAADDSPNSVMNVSINNCQPASGPTLDEQNQKLQAAVKYASEEKDVVVVSAAGNVGEKCEQNTESDPDKLKSYVSPPIFSDHVLSVGAIDEGGGVANFSMNGPWVGVAAPGTDIISLDPAEGSNRLVNQTIDPNGEAAPIEGTSFAAPYVSGLAVLVRQMHPGLSAEQVMDRIKYTAHHPAAADGHDQYIGQGVIDPVAALTGRVPSEENEQPVRPQALPDDLPPAHDPNETPFAVAVGGSAAALLAIGITMFVVHTVRRNQKPTQQGSDRSGSAGSR